MKNLIATLGIVLATLASASRDPGLCRLGSLERDDAVVTDAVQAVSGWADRRFAPTNAAEVADAARSAAQAAQTAAQAAQTAAGSAQSAAQTAQSTADEALASARDLSVTNLFPLASARPLPDHLHYIRFGSSYSSEAEEWYSLADYSAGCSARRSGNLLERNYDWKFDDMAEFVVEMPSGPGRFASVGVANVGTNLTESFVVSGKWSKWYKSLPGHTVDGVNENGVVAEVNVVGGDPQTSGWRTTGEIHPLGAVRWALDNATSAGMAASNLASRVKFPSGWTQNFHWMIADKGGTWIVENGSPHKVDGTAVMTNFRIYPSRDAAGEGQERYDALADGASITGQWWTAAYKTGANRISDFGNDASAMNAAQTAWNNGRTKEEHRGESFGGESWWQTVHTSVYDITNRTLKIAVQEIDDWYEFAVPSAGGVKPEDVLGIVEPVVAGATNGIPEAIAGATNGLRRVDDLSVYDLVSAWTMEQAPPDFDMVSQPLYHGGSTWTWEGENKYSEGMFSSWEANGGADATELDFMNEDVGFNFRARLVRGYERSRTNSIVKNNMLIDATNATLQAAKEYTDEHSGTGGITADDVRSIVTNKVDALTEWEYSGAFWEAITMTPRYDNNGIWIMSVTGTDMQARGGPDATRLEWHYWDELDDGDVLTISTRAPVKYNALGLVHKDTPTPQVKFAGGATNYVLVVENGKLNLYAEVPDED